MLLKKNKNITSHTGLLASIEVIVDYDNVGLEENFRKNRNLYMIVFY